MTDTAHRPVVIDAPAGLPWIDVTREFDAPVEAVFAAHADADLVRRWLGPDGYEMEVQHFDFRSGGGYRYTHRNPEGTVFAFRGVTHTVRENQLVVQTFEYLDWPDAVSLEYLTFERLDGDRTRLLGHSLYPDVESRDAMVSSGMEKGVTQGYRRLDALVA